MWLLFKEEFEDTKRVIRIRISKKNRQHNGLTKKDKQRSIKHTHKRAKKIYALLFIAHFHQLQLQDYTPNLTIPSNASLNPFETLSALHLNHGHSRASPALWYVGEEKGEGNYFTCYGRNLISNWIFSMKAKTKCYVASLFVCLFFCFYLFACYF